VDENTEFETVEQLTDELRKRLSEAKLNAVARQFSERALSTLVDQVQVEIPEALVRSEMDEHLHRFIHRLEDSEISIDDYFEISGISQEAFLEDLRLQSERTIRNQLVLEAVARDAGIEVTPEDVSAVIQALATQSGDPVAYLKAVRQSGRELALAGDILRNRAMDVILSAATPVDEDGNPVDLKVEVTDVEAEIVEASPVDEAAPGEVIAEPVEEEEE
jgi:trigger factor